MWDLAKLIQEKKARVVTYREPVTLPNNTAAFVNITVPKYKFWFIIGGTMYNADDVQRACSVRVREKEDRLIFYVFSQNVVAGGTQAWLGSPADNTIIPDLAQSNNPLVLDEGMDLYFGFGAGGASAGGTGEVMVFVIEVDKQ